MLTLKKPGTEWGTVQVGAVLESLLFIVTCNIFMRRVKVCKQSIKVKTSSFIRGPNRSTSIWYSYIQYLIVLVTLMFVQSHLVCAVYCWGLSQFSKLHQTKKDAVIHIKWCNICKGCHIVIVIINSILDVCKIVAVAALHPVSPSSPPGLCPTGLMLTPDTHPRFCECVMMNSDKIHSPSGKWAQRSALANNMSTIAEIMLQWAWKDFL